MVSQLLVIGRVVNFLYNTCNSVMDDVMLATITRHANENRFKRGICFGFKGTKNSQYTQYKFVKILLSTPN